jgi:UDP-3-O-[3-hydroxymyristoyl] glucosamine N-acyltransferase
VKLGRIAEAIGSTVPPAAADLEVLRVSSPEHADEHSLVFLSDPRYTDTVVACPAPAVIARPGTVIAHKHILEAADPYVGYARAAQLFEDRSPEFGPGVHVSALLAPGAVLGEKVAIGPGCVIAEGCRIGAQTVLGARVVLERGVTVGAGCRIDSGAILRRGVRLGNRVIVQSGAVIGSEGFGNAMHADGWVRIPCFGAVVIEDDAEIGANVTIDRGNFADTRIGAGARIDNLVHIAHNVEIGAHTAIAAQAGISGSTKVGSRVLIGGQAGFVGHIEIGDGAFVGAQAGVSKSVEPGAKVTGYPARDLMTMRRIDAALARLPEIVKEVRSLKREQGREQNT